MWNNEDTRLEVIDRLVSHVIERLPKEEAPLIKQFIRQYYLSVSPEDLTSKSVLDLYGAILSHWHYIANRKKGELSVRAYNPHLEQHGWQSTHTVIEIAFEDMPFLVDSVTMVLNRMELNMHFIIHMGSIRLKRNAEGKVIEVLDHKTLDNSVTPVAAIYIEIDRQSDPLMLQKIEENIRKVLNDVRTVVYDWPAMREEAVKTLGLLKSYQHLVEPDMLNEIIEFLQWLIEDHFTFMGYLEYKLEGSGESEAFRMVEGSGLGVMKDPSLDIKIRPLADMTQSARDHILSGEILMTGKTNVLSTVHRPAYRDFISIQILDERGKVLGEKVFVGLYTAVAYNSSPRQIPYLRRKVKMVLEKAGYVPKSHDDRALLNILETLPRDDVFQASVDELLDWGTGILHLQERQRIRLFVRRDTFGNFISCLVFVPRDSFSTAVRKKFQDILMRSFQGEEVDFSTRFSESSLARIHFVIRINPKNELEYNVKAIEQKLIEAGRTWRDELLSALIEQYGEERGNDFFKRYGMYFPEGYIETFPPRVAVVDIEYFDTLSDQNTLGMSLYRNIEDTQDVVRFKLFMMKSTMPLSDVVPILENMGLRIISERPYEILLKDNTSIWINDYRMVHPKGEFFDIDQVREIFQETFDHIWRGSAENDSFNKLVLGAKLNWREISLIRAYAKYLRQTGFSFSQTYIENTLVSNATIASELINLFRMRFDPERQDPESKQLNQKKNIEELLEKVASLDEDRILRRYLDVIFATVRTNFYQKGSNAEYKPYVSFKVHSAKLPELPLPVPLYEIFVYSPRVEAIHLRNSKVARGGIRWSDRLEDFRTEILGLMKTQQVKNAVIVPMGAKGGFVVKKLPEYGTREEIQEEVVHCYQTLIHGLLDITDNLKKNGVVPPEQVVRYDDDDPYLVVAADKGTATFSDLANSISHEYDFWLGDAFASGGSTGYDHKKMAITARGAWESVKRHFLEMDLDYHTQDFTVFGIGDMSGDVFGNGMLLSHHIKLIAAFNGQHIFIDPNPDPAVSFAERERLFKLPRSGWTDYNPALISQGGGVFDRKAKYIILSKEAQIALDFHQDRVIPNDLIRAILKAPAVLFWNGGIGTYVKSSQELNANVGDRANDAVRINGSELRCKVVGEGGNLGLTQLGRIEYAKKGGRLNTDAIDNSGGVNCSDNEVNIKILLNDSIDRGDLTIKQRNELLVLMQDEVAELVLWNNRRQTEAISITVSQAAENIEMHARLIQELEKTGELNRALEYLPDTEEIMNRKANKQGLTRPEVAVLMAYVKILLKQTLLKSEVPDEPYMFKALEHAFPAVLRVGFKEGMKRHHLKREIIATRVSNITINEMGITFLYRLKDETGAYDADIIRAYAVAREVFSAIELRKEIHNLAGSVEATVILRMIHEVNRLIRRGVRWFLRNRGTNLPVEELIAHYKPYIQEVSELLPKFIGSYGEEIAATENSLIQANVPLDLARKIANTSAMFSALDIVEASVMHKLPVEQVVEVYYAIGRYLHLDWFREAIKNHSVSNHWEALARATYRDDLDRQQRNLTVSILKLNGPKFLNMESLIDHWMKKHTLLVDRWEYFVTELRNATDPDFTMFSVALRELLDLSQVRDHNKKNKGKEARLKHMKDDSGDDPEENIENVTPKKQEKTEKSEKHMAQRISTQEKRSKHKKSKTKKGDNG